MTKPNAVADRATLGEIASHYMSSLWAYLYPSSQPADMPLGWEPGSLKFDLVDGEEPFDVMHWLHIWPPVGIDSPGDPPRLASWNLSRASRGHGLPATIVMVATEFMDRLGEIAQFTKGYRVPMRVTQDGDGIKVVITSMTAEYPSSSQASWSTVNEIVDLGDDKARQSLLDTLIGTLKDNSTGLNDMIGGSASVIPESMTLEQISFLLNNRSSSGDEIAALNQPFELDLVYKARGSVARAPEALSYQVNSRIEVTPVFGPNFTLKLLSTDTCALVTHVGEGEARVLRQTPSANRLPFDAAKPDARYDWTRRRPTRVDEILDRFRETIRVANAASKKLEHTGFRVQLCPRYVPEDEAPARNGEQTKLIQLAAHEKIDLRSNEFSALSAYYNCLDFFERLQRYGVFLDEFVTRAEPELHVHYRYGVTPGPGSDGRTINAQVAYDCKSDEEAPPRIRMNLALAELSRWDRPVQPDGERKWAEPLGIATDTRWILHELGHYLLAARLGRLEFEFCHSAGDAMAAIACDPASRLADPRNGVADSFRGITFPFVFSTRRHDRSPTLGWAWYGELNRSVLENPPQGCDDLKGYLTEQILSTTLFRLYRSLGGDSIDGTAPDTYLRERASFLTLYLLVRGIQSFAQSPTKAEMLELAMEDIGSLQGSVLAMSPAPDAGLSDTWKAGLTHKVVRWAFETQGMFVADVAATHNGPGQPQPIDVYIADRRPEREMINDSWFDYGPGSYCPVSLDWRDAPLWQMDAGITIGNRGTDDAPESTLRLWVGLVSNPEDNWGLDAHIHWFPTLGPVPVDAIGAGASRDFRLDEVAQGALDGLTAEAKELAEATLPANGTGHILILYELSNIFDPANTDPQRNLDVAVENKNDLPETARVLTDLVAGDNNLGLQSFRFL